MENRAFNMDCMEAMRSMPDQCFDLAVVDPPYGIRISNNMGRRKGERPSGYKKVTWDDTPPPPEYFTELVRVSKNQIIFGANHFVSLIPAADSSCWISVTIPDWVPGVGGKTLGFNIPTIPQLAEGGVATSPTLAEIGEGGEPEAVMPLSKLAALLDEYTKKPKPTGGTDGQEGGDGETIVFSPVLNFYGKADREEVEEATRISFEEFKRLYKRLKAEERRKKFKPEPAMG